MQFKEIMKRVLLTGIVICLFLLLVFIHPFYYIDNMLCDTLYRQTDGVSPTIKIIAIDEETMEQYGKFEIWAREKTAQTVALLSSNPECSPAMIGLDLLFTDSSGTESDENLAEACASAKYVVMSSNIVYRGTTQMTEDRNVYFDAGNIALIEKPYEELDQVIEHGFANALIAPDGVVRHVRLFEKFQGEIFENFSWKLYSKYKKLCGEEPIIPKLDGKGQLEFFYSGGIGEFPHFSMSRVLSGEVPVSEFKDCIVLVGAYAPGFQDAYGTAVDFGGQMYGVEIHANVIQALMEEKTAVPVQTWLYCLVTSIILLLYVMIAQRQKLLIVLLEGSFLLILHLAAGRAMAFHGYTITQVSFLVVIILTMMYFVVQKYFTELLRKKKLLAVFKTYVAPQVVDVLSKDDHFANRLGGEKRHVAVLFVDIRGFTSMSEGLQPEDVVKILNEYLALTTKCIFQNQGTLDKFIGDATMAVFNAPVDQPDYIYRSVAAALDMKQEMEEVSQRLLQNYGKQVSFGIGIHCGEAVIGNIGCQVRMDYTAIGDTVNTASRLESCAKRGEILISEQVNQEIEDRILTEYVSEMELKGKSHTVRTYRVLGYKGGKTGE